jgi:excinuclease ABC subunit C
LAVERTLEPQKVAAVGAIDQDAIGLCREGGPLSIYLLFVREGRVIGGRPFLSADLGFPEGELLASFLNQYYGQNHFVPDEILLPLEIEGMAGLQELLSDRKGSRVRLLVPRGGARRALLEMSARNARQAVRQPHPGKQEPEVLERLQQRLHLLNLPRRMECFDVSHFHGEGIVASKVAMVDGVLDKDHYRRYRIQTVQVGDDYRALGEALSRRLRQGLEENDLPDLIVMDGGRMQLSAGLAALEEHHVAGVDLIALAKEREMGAPQPQGEVAQAPERIFVPGKKDPIVLPPSSPEMLLLMRLRDEAHRFAISYQRKLSRREKLHSQLEEIPGIGPQRKKALLRRFGSVKGVARASLNELSETEGLGEETARRVHAFFHNGRPNAGVGKHAPPSHPR